MHTGAIPVPAAGPTLIVLTPNHAALLDVLRLRFPDGIAHAFPDNDPGGLDRLPCLHHPGQTMTRAVTLASIP